MSRLGEDCQQTLAQAAQFTEVLSPCTSGTRCTAAEGTQKLGEGDWEVLMTG